ncbi:Trichodiene synthase [Hypsizygus marmoreus]|uniref:Trichodiene synthase n=1 Tax=Hypsizygus marmoreus TaxID=39966 RepID=A0A369JVL2_HYPMA|nr:Trichodiene synthase [Hypsizygus marmoreus]
MSQPHATLAGRLDQNVVSKILREFLTGTSLRETSMPVDGVNEELEMAMRAEMNARNLSAQLERTLHLAASLIELAYKGCTFSEKRNIALYNWYLIYVDDTASRDMAPFVVFEQRFLRGLRQLDPVLDALASVLLAMYDKYDTRSANSIISATFNFMSATCMESTIEALPLIEGALRFPWFLRDWTGVAVAFALMIFPKSQGLDVAACFQVTADMNFWISATNDILSFHKENLAGERANYIFNRAYIEGTDVSEAMTDIKNELFQTEKNITAALTCAGVADAIKAWKCFKVGYITWHLQQKRYKLHEFDL